MNAEETKALIHDIEQLMEDTKHRLQDGMDTEELLIMIYRDIHFLSLKYYPPLILKSSDQKQHILSRLQKQAHFANYKPNIGTDTPIDTTWRELPGGSICVIDGFDVNRVQDYLIPMLDVACRERSIRTALFSYSYPTVQLASDLLAYQAKIDRQQMATGDLEHPQWDALEEAVAQWSEDGMYWVDADRWNLPHLQQQALKIYKENGLSLIVLVDVLEAMGLLPGSADYARVNDALIELKTLAKMLDLPFLVFSSHQYTDLPVAADVHMSFADTTNVSPLVLRNYYR